MNDRTEPLPHLQPGRRLPPVIVLASPALPSWYLTLARNSVPLVLPVQALSQAVLVRLRPPAVVLALFCPDHDALRLVGRLERMDYRGRIILVSPPLPDREMVMAELRKQHPDARCRVAILPDLADHPV